MAIHYALDTGTIDGAMPSEAAGDGTTTASTTAASATTGTATAPATTANAAAPHHWPVQIVNTKEFDELTFVHQEARTELCDLERDRTNYIDIFPEFYLGSLAIPERGNLDAEPELIAFYLDATHLLLITEGNLSQQILDEIAIDNKIPRLDCARCLFYLLNQVLMKDLGWLSGLEDEMEDLEERIIADVDDVTTKTMIQLRRIASKQGTFYQEIGDIAEVLANDVNDIITESASRRFQNLTGHCDRLNARADALKEYSMQLHELYQTQLDEKQNRIMEIFTVVTVVIAPLTLITGWFGMNIPIPGLQFGFTWIILIIAGALMSGGIVAFIKLKNWI